MTRRIRYFSFFVIAILAVIVGVSAPSRAQQEDIVWVQIEAHPSQRVALERAQIYAQDLADVNAFSLGGSWSGILLGPYLRSDAEQVLRVYRAEGQIPRDSYIVRSRALGRQFYPPNVDLLNRGAPAQPPVSDPATPQPQISQAAPEPVIDETPNEARRSERLLTAQERRDLQIALRWGGYYNAAIDGAYGPGTRRSMAAWQSDNGYDQTGILTTRQRQELMDQYNAPLISAGMRLHRDTRAGIEIELPLAAVRQGRYDAPFVHFEATGAVPGAKVLLISQDGTQDTLFGLYEIMQTLEIVPFDGARERGNDSFVLEGRDRSTVSHTEVSLANGALKGFTLVWPTGDEERRQRVLTAMQETFQRTPGALDLALTDTVQQDLDLISGLRVRKPRLSRTGFYIDRSGSVMTTVAAVQGCTRVTLDTDYPAQVVASDDTLGLAVLRPSTSLVPLEYAGFAADDPRLRSEIAVAGYSFEGVLGAPTLTFGTLADLKGLRGEPDMQRLALTPLPGDAGGPVLDSAGRVVGMLLSAPAGAQQLPQNVSLAADAEALQAFLGQAGLRPSASRSTGQSLDPLDLFRVAEGMTVLVSCWD